MKVSVKESSTVLPAAGDNTAAPRQQRVWLSNMDLLQLKTRHMRTLYAYNNTDDSSHNFFDPKVLKEALSKALAVYYPLAGRLARDGGKGRLELDCSGGDGVLFLEAEADFSMSELGDFVPSGDEIQQLLHQLVPAVDYSQHISSYPMLLLQITRFKCGGVCVGIAIHHIVCDGRASLSFISTWSDMARELSTTHEFISSPATPFLDRAVLGARQPATPKFHHTEYDPRPTLINKNTHPQPLTTTTTTTVIATVKLTQDQLDVLKEKAHHHHLTYTTYEVLAAHIWRCASKARDLPDEQLTKLSIPIDGRSRLDPQLPSGYFGNVVFHATPIAQAGELASEPMVRTAERIRRAIERMNDEYLRSATDYLEGTDQDSQGGIQGPGYCESPNLKLVSWMRHPFEGADFGWGRPILTRLVNFNELMGYILPRNEDGSVSLAIRLEADAMQGFKRLFQDV